MLQYCFHKALCVLIVLALFAPRALFGQDEKAEGDFLVGEGQYDEAITSYLKFLFFNPGSGKESEVCRKISRAYVELGDEEKALRYADLALQKAKNESERRERVFERAELLLALGRPDAARLEMELLVPLDLTRPESERRLFLQGTAAVYLGQWEEAASLFGCSFTLSAAYPPETEARVLKLLHFGAQMRPADPEAARLLSFILPGSGQVYAGDPLAGLNSLIVTGSAGALVVWAIASGDYFDAAAAVFFVFERFYVGGSANAARYASERNEERDDAIRRAVLDLLAR